MKILYVITRAERGGGQVHLVDLLSNLPCNYQPILATGEYGYLTEEAGKLNIPVYVVPNLVQPMRPGKDLRALASLVKLIRSQAPTLIHAHTSKAGLLARLAGRLCGTPVIFTAHTWSFADGIPHWQQKLTIPLERIAAWRSGKIISRSRNEFSFLNNSIKL